MKKIKFILLFINICFLLFLSGCGDHDYNKNVEPGTYLKGTLKLSGSTLSGADVIMYYGGRKYETVSSKNVYFKLNIDDSVVSKQVYFLEILQGTQEQPKKLNSYVISDNYGNVEDIEINEKSDAKGWSYADNFKSEFGPKSGGKVVRTRKWVRYAKYMKDINDE